MFSSHFTAFFWSIGIPLQFLKPGYLPVPTKRLFTACSESGMELWLGSDWCLDRCRWGDLLKKLQIVLSQNRGFLLIILIPLRMGILPYHKKQQSGVLKWYSTVKFMGAESYIYPLPRMLGCSNMLNKHIGTHQKLQLCYHKQEEMQRE